MKVEEGKYSVAELVDWLRTKQLIVNVQYQRGGGLWPAAPRSYFIDTILRGFPFPKVYFHERLDPSTKKPRREIVDGQQRLNAILEFADDQYALGQNAREFSGCRLSTLPEDVQDAFWSYTVAVDVIRNADRTEILQMFRRMNAFTLPLNEAEKRHSEFFGMFKDWINQILDEYGSVLTDWGVMTSRQVVRMGDAEFFADLALAVKDGIVSTSPKKLRDLYKEFDDAFPVDTGVQGKISGAFDSLVENLSNIQGTYATRPHVFHSLLCAMIHNKFGLPGTEAQTGIAPMGAYFTDRDAASTSILSLASAHEEKDYGKFSAYVLAASEGGNRAAQRAVRVAWLCRALRGEFA